MRLAHLILVLFVNLLLVVVEVLLVPLLQTLVVLLVQLANISLLDQLVLLILVQTVTLLPTAPQAILVHLDPTLSAQLVLLELTLYQEPCQAALHAHKLECARLKSFVLQPLTLFVLLVPLAITALQVHQTLVLFVHLSLAVAQLRRLVQLPLTPAVLAAPQAISRLLEPLATPMFARLVAPFPTAHLL